LIDFPVKSIAAAALALAAAGALGQNVPRLEPLDVPAAPSSPPSRVEFNLPPLAPGNWIPTEKVQVRGFRFNGLHSVPEALLQDFVAQWVGRSLDGAQLAELAAALTAKLRDTGLLIAQAWIPDQEARDGFVRVEVVEGRIGSVQLDTDGSSRLRRNVAERFLAPIRPGDVATRANVEQSLLVLNDLPGIRLDAALTAGANSEQADVRVKVVDDGAPISGTIRVDNAGLRAAGEIRGDINVRLRSPLGLGDLASARYLQSSGAGQTLASLTYGLPVSGYGTRVGLRVAEQRYRLNKEFTPLEATGDQHAIAMLASHPLIRRSDHNLMLAASYSETSYLDRLGAFALTSNSRHRVAAVSATYDSRDAWLGGGANGFQFQQLRGRAIQKDPFFLALDTDPGGLNVYGRYSVTRYRAQREQSLDRSTSLYIAMNGQFASRNLDAGAELPLGGPDGVRAYPVGELYADEGYIARVELRRRFSITDASTTALIAFIDEARVRINRNPLPGDPANRRGLGAYGFGVAHAAGRGLALQAWFAWRMSESAFTAPDRSPRVWVALTAAF
jgi:hemolysin activation/secretion protein